MKIWLATRSAATCSDWAATLSRIPIATDISGQATAPAALVHMLQEQAPACLLLEAGLFAGEALLDFLAYWGKRLPIILAGAADALPPAPILYAQGIFELLYLPLDTAKLWQTLLALSNQTDPGARTLLPGSSAVTQKLATGRLLISYARRLPADSQLSEQEANSLYGTHFRPGAFRYLTLCLDTPQASAEFELDIALATAQMTILEKTARLCFESCLKRDYLRYQILLNYSPDCDGALLQQLQECLAEIQKQLPPRVSLTICCSHMHVSLTELVRLLDESGDAIWERLSGHTGRLLIGTTPAPCSRELLQLLDNAEQEMRSACAVLNLEGFLQQLHTLSRLPSPNKQCHEMRMVLRRTQRYMFQINRELIATSADVATAYQEVTLRLRQVSSVEEYLQVYTQQMTALFQKIQAHATPQHSRPIRQAQQLIQQNLAAPLKLELVAQRVGLSPVYFSAVFKKETGIGFSDYINQCRIAQAKQLLAETGLKILAISSAVGFSSPRYFSRVFRELVGVRPSEYRIAVQRKEEPKENQSL